MEDTNPGAAEQVSGQANAAADQTVDAGEKDVVTLVHEAAEHIKEFIDTHIPKLTVFGYAELGDLPAKLKAWLSDVEKSFGKK